jgi:peroxiredoxin Q/BCP
MQEQVRLGEMVPDFTLASSNGTDVSLSDFRGRRLIVYFYPKDQTPACTQEACDFRDYTPMLREKGTEVVGISPDDLKAHGKFSEKYSLPFELLSDPAREVCGLFGVWKLKKLYGREYMGVERSTFLIDGEGRLVREWRKVRVKNHVQDVLAALDSI